MIGTVLAGRYELTGLLQEGPIFMLYGARDRLTGRESSIRIVKPPYAAEEGFVQALRSVVEKTKGIVHPGIERLLDVDTDESGVYVVGDLTRAPTLADRIRKLAPFSSPVAVATAISVCRALDALHRADIVHGDVSPENACLLADGEVRLQMAGVWVAYSASTTAGAVVLPSLAPALAPEVGSGGMPSLRSDVYAVGVLLYELLTGRKPFTGDTAVATALKHVSEPTPSVRALNPSVPAVLDQIVQKAMSKDPANRYATAGDMLADLRLLQDALRFGRSLSWPLRNPSPVTNTKAAPAPAARVAPRMSAIRDEDDERQPRDVHRDRDVPVWMLLVIVFLGTVVISLFGVWFFLNMNRPRLVTIPNLRGLTVPEARLALGTQHLNLKVGQRVVNDRVEADHVTDVDPPAGTRARENSDVTVELSAGRKEVEVPELRGRTSDQARSDLEKVDLQLDENIGQANDPAFPEKTIVRQAPKVGSTVDRNSKVRIWINRPSSGNESPAAPPSGHSDASYVYTLNIVLSDAQGPVQLRVEMTDEDGTRTIYDQRRQPGDSVDVTATGRGEEAHFKLYYDDRLVKEFTQKATGEQP